MNKKYTILNSNLIENNDDPVLYVFYMILFFVVIFIIYKIIHYIVYTDDLKKTFYLKSHNNKSKNILHEELNKNEIEKFDNLSQDVNKLQKLSSAEIVEQLINKNNELTNIKNTIQDKLEKQSKAIYISNNYNKVDASSFDDELYFSLYNFSNTQFPEINLDNKKIIKNQSDLDSVLNKVKLMKNFYKPGEIVTSNSTFDINKNNICHRHDGKSIKPTSDFLQKYPECMVCSIESDQNIYDSNSWKTTKTNINKVCLFNPSAESNSGIPNLSDCQKFCNIQVPKSTTSVTTISTK